MTRRTNASIAGVTFLVYIAATIASIVLFTRATSGEGVAAQLAGIAQHATDVRLTILLGLLGNLCALVLGVTLYAITREQDPDLAMLALICRVAEGIAGMDVSKTLGLLWLATATDATAPDAGATSALGAFLLKMEGSFTASAAFFALGSTIFAWLLLRGRMIPVALGLVRRACVDPARRMLSSAARRTARRPGHVVHVVSGLAIRGGAGAVADHQGRRPAGAEATGLRVATTPPPSAVLTPSRSPGACFESLRAPGRDAISYRRPPRPPRSPPRPPRPPRSPPRPPRSPRSPPRSRSPGAGPWGMPSYWAGS